MRGTVAKRLRKKVYGEASRRNTGEYYYRHPKEDRVTVVCSGKRGDYLEEKADYKRRLQ